MRWIPAIAWMGLIFAASATPAADIPDFGLLDFLVKKGGHMLAYAVLSTLYWRALQRGGRRRWQAWLLAVLFALTDEFHQVFVAGRHPSLVDVFVFDGGGAALAQWLGNWLENRRAT